VTIQVYEGERSRVADNNLLGSFNLTNLGRDSNGHSRIEITFDLDANGILTVTAVDLRSKASERLVITNDRGRLSCEEIVNMVREAEENRQKDLHLFNKLKHLDPQLNMLRWHDAETSVQEESLSRKTSGCKLETSKDIIEFLQLQLNKANVSDFDVFKNSIFLERYKDVVSGREGF
jgi:molecular chaperone DnaK (HSP70)